MLLPVATIFVASPLPPPPPAGLRMIPVLVIEDKRLVRLMVMDLQPVSSNGVEVASNGSSLSHLLPEDPRITNRERQIVQLIADGLSNKEIGKRLHIATNTVKGHVHNILEKLELRTRLQIAAHMRVRS